MQNQRGFIGVGFLIAILIGVAVLGGGAYYVVNQQAPSQTAKENFDSVQTLPTTNNQTQQIQPTTKTPAQTQTSLSETFAATPTSGTAPLTVRFTQTALDDWRAYIDYGDGTGCGTERPNDSENCSKFTHTYTVPGTYVATLKSLTGTDGASRPPFGPVTITVKGRESVSQNVAVPGMSKYTDNEFGFSFWYSSGWSVLEDAPLDRIVPTTYADGTLVKRLVISGGGRTLYIDEVHSDSRTFNVNPGACGACGPVAYSFNPDSHLWMMTTSNQQPSAQPANISNNSMGGLHIFPSGQKESAVIVPLSARNFVFVKDVTYSDQCGSYCASPDIKGGAQFLAKTIVATDPSVATPVSASEQTATIQAAASAYGN